MKPAKKNNPTAAAKPSNPIKKIFKYLFLIVLFLVFGRALSFYDFPYLDILHYIRPEMTDEEVFKLLNPAASKGYTYPAPSALAASRVVNCNDIISTYEFPRLNPLCLNMFQTDAKDITSQVASGSYDRIILYGQYSVYDAPTSAPGEKNYIADLYNTVKFMDLIAIPKFLAAYGLSDVSYIRVTKPYPYLYYRISSLEDADKVCHYGDATEKVKGCARSYYSSIIPVSAIGPQMSDARPLVRKTDKKRFSYLTHYPADCFTNDTFAHETAHLLNDAGEGFTGKYVMDSWFNEQVAGFFAIYGADLACGDGTVTMQKEKGVDVGKALAEFNSVFPPMDLSHGYPTDVCEQGMLTQWYQFLLKGNYRDNFRTFFMKQRSQTPSLIDDRVFTTFLLGLDPSTQARELLTSKGCTP